MTVTDSRIRLQLFQRLLDHSTDAIVFVDPGNRIRVWNAAAESLLGAAGSEFAENQHVRASVTVSPDQCVESASAPNDEVRSTIEIQMTETDTCLKVERRSRPIDVDGKSWWLVTLRKTPARSPTESELYKLAQTDSLSGLLNRRGFQAALEASLNRPLVVAIIDVDFFKHINDQHGHATGDQAITWLGIQLNAMFADAICIGRLGGDEFGVVLSMADQGEIEGRFQKFCDTISGDSKTWYLDGMAISIGVAIGGSGGISARELLTRADRALYQSKNEGRNRVTLVLI